MFLHRVTPYSYRSHIPLDDLRVEFRRRRAKSRVNRVAWASRSECVSVVFTLSELRTSKSKLQSRYFNDSVDAELGHSVHYSAWQRVNETIRVWLSSAACRHMSRLVLLVLVQLCICRDSGLSFVDFQSFRFFAVLKNESTQLCEGIFAFTATDCQVPLVLLYFIAQYIVA